MNEPTTVNLFIGRNIDIVSATNTEQLEWNKVDNQKNKHPIVMLNNFFPFNGEVQKDKP